MAEEVKGILIRGEHLKGLQMLSDSQRGRLLIALFADCGSCEFPELDDMTKVVFELIVPSVRRANDAYEKRREANRNNGSKGGRPKKTDVITEEPNALTQKPIAFSVKSENPNEAKRSEAYIETPLTPQQDYKPETVTLFTLCNSSASPSGCDFSPAEDKATNGGKKKGFSEDFNRFWEKYPRKVSKGQAWKTWQKLQKDGTLPDVDTLIEAVRWRQLEPDWEKDGGKYIPHASTWLNACGWEDEGCKAPEQIPNDPREERAVEICKNHGIDYYFCACPCTQEAAVDKYKRLIAATRELREEGLELYEPFRENFRGHLRRYGVLEQVEEELGWTEGA